MGFAKIRMALRGNREDASDEALIEFVAAALDAADWTRARRPALPPATCAAVEILERRLIARGALGAEEDQWDSPLCRARRAWAEGSVAL